ncbi:MAG TPA: GNAT family N-acetyltransferase [Alphaproteobacteria bacterium]|nr:GNAT family N-acetyltransferase [Alphaproteobacteria bacterium]
MLYNLRLANVDDADDLSAIRSACFDSAWTPETFTNMLRDDKNFCLLIPDTAYALVQKIPPEAELITIAVVPAARRRGIAENMLIRTWQELQQHGIHTLHLEVNERLAAARQLYEKLGFQTTGRRNGYYPNKAGSPDDAILMKLETPL